MGSKKTLIILAALYAAVATPSASAAPRPHVTWLRGDGNYTKASRGPAAIDYVVVHVTEGSFWGSVRWLQNKDSGGSAHYVVSRSGKIVQLVHQSDIAWHAGNWRVNAHSVGIEHEGITDDPGGFTLAEYRASARLAAFVARTSLLPIDRKHFIGHDEVPDPFRAGAAGGSSHHTDPGPFWKWKLYLSLVRRYASPGTPPPLRVESSIANGTLAGREDWRARTTQKVDRVEFRVDGRLVWRDHVAPYGHALNTALLKNGRHTLEARAVSHRGSVVLARQKVRVANSALALTTAKLHDGQDVRGTLRFRANTRGPATHGITLLVDGKPVARDARRPFALSWNSKRVADGPHRLELVARAHDGRVARRLVRVLVRNAKPKAAPKQKPALPEPQIVSTTIADGQTLAGTIAWSFELRGSVARVDLYVDGTLRARITERPLTWSWDTALEQPGQHTLLARAVSRDGRSSERRVTVTVTAEAPPA
jgi:N-acetyl-anhydromuramyl-L-alanine amidase AmpD